MLKRDKDEPMLAREFAAIGFTPGRASRYIKPLVVQPGHIYLICSRVSNRERQENLDDQDDNLCSQVTSQGGIAVSCDWSRRIGSGFDPSWVSFAASVAKPLGATLLAESTDRFIRNIHFHSVDYPDVRATDAELRDLVECARGVPLMTWLDPDMPLHEVRSHQSKRGQRAKGRKGGRPRNQTPGYKLRRRQLWLPRVRKLRRWGKSIGEIVKETGLPKTVVWEWTQ